MESCLRWIDISARESRFKLTSTPVMCVKYRVTC